MNEYKIDEEGLNKHREQTVKEIQELLIKHNRVACVRYTGYGKSYFLVRKIIKQIKEKIIIVVPNDVLKIHYQEQYASNKNIVILTYQIIKNLDGNYIYQNYKNFNLIIADECHHLLAPKWKTEFERLENLTKAKVLGLTATPELLNGFNVVDEFFNGVQVEPLQLLEGIKLNFLPKIKYVIAYTNLPKQEYLNDRRFSDVDRYKITNLLNVENILKTYIDEDYRNKNLKILVFISRINLIKSSKAQVYKWFSNIFPDKEINIFSVSSEKTISFNTNQLSQFSKDRDSNTIDIMISVDKLIEGLHLHSISIEIIFRKTKSSRVYFQQIGRTINSNYPLVFDLVDNSSHIYAEGNNYYSNLSHKTVIDRTKIMFDDYIELIDKVIEMEDILSKYKKFEKIPIEICEQIIKEDNLTISEIAKKYKISKSSVSSIFKKYGIIRNINTTKEIQNSNYKIIEQNLNFIIDNSGRLSREQIANKLNIPLNTLNNYCKNHEINLERINPRIDIDDKLRLKFIKLKQKHISKKKIMEKLNINERIYEALIRDSQVKNQLPSNRNTLSKEQKEYLLNNCLEKTTAELSKDLNLPVTYVRDWLRRNKGDYKKIKTATNITPLLERQVIDNYKELKSLYKVSKALNIHKQTVKKILLKNNIKLVK